jgi:MobA-like NTP transferase domain
MSGPTLVILAAGRARRYGGLKQLAPIGMHGEGVIDLLASDAFAAGFQDVVIVINPDTGPQIVEHVERFWPREHRVSFAIQENLRGTVDAVLCAVPHLDPHTPFGVSNADDLYGRDALAKLGQHLMTSKNNCLIGFQLDRALIGDLPVSRGTCNVINGHLTEIVERRNVCMTLEGFVADDGLDPAILNPETTVSLNLWGFQPGIWPLMQLAVEDHDFTDSPEILLPIFVGDILGHTPMRFDVLRTSSRCIGVTHADDLPLAQILVREDIESGARPEFAFS